MVTRLPTLLFALALAIGAVIAVAVWGSGDPVPQSVAHPEYPTLLRATDGAERVAPVAVLGVAFAGLQVLFLGGCLALGLRRRGSLGPIAKPLGLGLALYGAVFALLLLAYRSFLADPAASLVLSFPRPTAVMLYGLWPVPLVFAWIYLRHFDDWVMDEEEVERVLAAAASDPADRVEEA